MTEEEPPPSKDDDGQPPADPQLHAAGVPHPAPPPTQPDPLALEGLPARETAEETAAERSTPITETVPRAPAPTETAIKSIAPPIRFFPLRLLVVIVAALALAFPVYKLLPYAQFPFIRANVAIAHGWFQMDNEEAALLFQTMEISRGFSIYHPLKDYPYVAGTYPPVYMALNALFLNHDNPSFLAGRIMSCAAAIGIAVLILSVVVLRSRHVVAGMLGALLFVVTYELYSWIPYYRVDLLAIFFSVLGVGCMALSPWEKSGWIVSLACFTLAFFTKQTQIAAPIAVVLFLLLSRPRLAIKYALYLALLIGSCVIILSVFTRGQFLRHTVLYNMNTYHWNDVVIWANHLLRFYRWFILAAATILAGLLLTALTNPRVKILPAADGKKVKPRSGIFIDPLVFYMITSLINLIAVGKAGSAENYLLEPIAAVALGTSDGFARLSRAVLTSRFFIVPATTILAAGWMFFNYVAKEGQSVPEFAPVFFQPSKIPTQRDFTAAAEVVRRVQSESGETWSEPGFQNLLANRPIYFQQFIMSELARQKKWDQRRFLEDIRSRKFKLIVLTVDIFKAPGTVLTPEIVKALQRGYELDHSVVYGTMWKYYIYRPFRVGRPRLDIAQASRPAILYY